MKTVIFRDRVKLYAKAGNGGPGCVSFRREKFIPKGGPDGGDGGHGGSVILRCDIEEDSLLPIFYEPHRKAKNAQHGMGSNCHGKNSEDCIVKVAPGTVVIDSETDEFIGELVNDGEELIIAKGGHGGIGNARFKSSTNRAPRQFTEGTEGEEKTVWLELKLISDVGLVGYPNAGKSTLLSKLTNASPKVAPYPFTTINPIIGTLQYEDFNRIKIADIPGLIDGANEGIGLGHHFLRHIERNSILVFLVSCESKNIDRKFNILLDELNRSNVPRVLGDLLTTLEPSKRTKPIFSEESIGFSDFNFVSATIAIPGEGAQTGLRFSVPLMRWANSDQGEVRYLSNPREYEIGAGSKSEGARDFSKSEFDGSLGALHSILDKLNLYEIVFIFINGVAHPVVSPEVVERIITGQDLGSISKIQILFEEGIRTYFVDDLTFIDGSDFANGKVAGSISLNLSIPLSNNRCNCYDENGKENEDMVSDYYWCENCDDMWDYTDRTEVSLSGSKKLLHVPNNLLVVATMNTTDRSVAPLDAALRRRFVFLRVDPLDKIPRKAKRNLDTEELKIFNETEKLWIKLNENLTTTLGHDATIGHSYLFDLIKELERAESIDMCYELRRQFWKYSVLPQVADLLDATGRSNSVWVGMKMEKSFKRIGLGLDTGPEKFKSFARTIIVEVEDDEEESIDTNQTEEESETTEDTEAIESSSDEND